MKMVRRKEVSGLRSFLVITDPKPNAFVLININVSVIYNLCFFHLFFSIACFLSCRQTIKIDFLSLVIYMQLYQKKIYVKIKVDAIIVLIIKSYL